MNRITRTLVIRTSSSSACTLANSSSSCRLYSSSSSTQHPQQPSQTPEEKEMELIRQKIKEVEEKTRNLRALNGNKDLLERLKDLVTDRPNHSALDAEYPGNPEHALYFKKKREAELRGEVYVHHEEHKKHHDDHHHHEDGHHDDGHHDDHHEDHHHEEEEETEDRGYLFGQTADYKGAPFIVPLFLAMLSFPVYYFYETVTQPKVNREFHITDNKSKYFSENPNAKSKYDAVAKHGNFPLSNPEKSK